MSVLPRGRVQCDQCLTVYVPDALNSGHCGADLYTAGWRARLIGRRYRHACWMCAADLIAKFEANYPVDNAP